MFGTFVLTALLASAAVLVRADVQPDVPGPGVVYKEGGTCHIEWIGDKDSTTAWKDMAIQLMTGDNFNMVHLTTVATGLDGTTSGNFDHPCPAVTPNSAIYFYQFTAPGATSKQWTTRFAIASATGQTTPPPNPTQPGTNAAIPWGTGALADPSKAVPPPSFVNGSSGTPPAGSVPPAPPTASTSATAGATQDPNSLVSTSTVTPTRFTTVVTASATSSGTPAATGGANSTNAQTKDNAAAALGVDGRVWRAALALGASAAAFAVLL
ncbi:putative ser-Thr-rich glycosyl-phosphatidyl-inositol-anchored membrane family protein [Lyophyllum shimeji]|uniref:Ser-Thr-rich glycosyl-phosphatidyl-inositol-anchored membrane family protein n=1 Tax=Lyophyllum shimeji TaxID=47721 RepID=A0A9P3PTQ5_LYOSH|nr:putative ser-Thr-rich glycosyl-phosphatidyl-inositol-anchored membrane family protein [Lyophyllum shimeji]